MRAVVLFTLLCFCCLFQVSSADDLLQQLVTLIILYLENIVKYYKTIDIISEPQSLLLNTSIAKGSLSCDKIFLYGLNGLVLDRDYITFNLDTEAKNIEFALYISIPSEVGIQVSTYKADVGIVDEIPLYGSGNISVSIKKLKVNISTHITYEDKAELTNFEIKPSLGLAKVNLTGFWNNDDLSRVISTVLSAILDIVVLFWDLELNCISCVLSTAIESALNKSEDIWTDIQTQCNATCVISSYSLVQTAFTSNMSETIQNISEDDIVKYIGMAKDYLVANIEDHL